MQEASEQTGKLADSGRRFTDEEPRYSVHFWRDLPCSKEYSPSLQVKPLICSPTEKDLEQEIQKP